MLEFRAWRILYRSKRTAYFTYFVHDDVWPSVSARFAVYFLFSLEMWKFNVRSCRHRYKNSWTSQVLLYARSAMFVSQASIDKQICFPQIGCCFRKRFACGACANYSKVETSDDQYDLPQNCVFTRSWHWMHDWSAADCIYVDPRLVMFLVYVYTEYWYRLCAMRAAAAAC